MAAIYPSGGAEANIEPVPKPPKLLDRMRHALQAKHYAYRTQGAFSLDAYRNMVQGLDWLPPSW